MIRPGRNGWPVVNGEPEMELGAEGDMEPRIEMPDADGWLGGDGGAGAGPERPER